MTLANILRTDAHAHRPLPADSELVQAVAVLSRATQDAIWRRSRATQELRAVLREYYPGFLAAFAKGGATNLASAEARAILALAPTPAAAAKITKVRIAAALRHAGRQRGIDALARQVLDDLRQPQLRQPQLVEDAFGHQALAPLATLNAECASADQLTESTTTAFPAAPGLRDHHQLPGPGRPVGRTRPGRDRRRSCTLHRRRSLKAYAGSAPVTGASGRSISITRRTVKNDRLNATGFVWAFASIGRAGAPRDHYHRRRAHGDRHAAALRHLINRFLGQLHHCLQTGHAFDPAKAFDPLPARQRRPLLDS
ncbi:hypothetical protein GCM10017567_35050 [Amycolatopsis bullii]|uniref:Transposase IS110-like N-terminal domain-containing protein n=1 Tax=Amycolatopsis bullii TaxID=941987 RepID=A0ABQ3KD11_9PSEU|nr:hypothetical protein GCM10017567_35050 [Amycolatopsis bullii]